MALRELKSRTLRVYNAAGKLLFEVAARSRAPTLTGRCRADQQQLDDLYRPDAATAVLESVPADGGDVLLSHFRYERGVSIFYFPGDPS